MGLKIVTGTAQAPAATLVPIAILIIPNPDCFPDY